MRMRAFAMPVKVDFVETITPDEVYPFVFTLAEFVELYWRIKGWSASISFDVTWNDSFDEPQAASLAENYILVDDGITGQENSRIKDAYERAQPFDSAHVFYSVYSESPNYVSVDILGCGDTSVPGGSTRGKWSGNHGGDAGNVAPRVEFYAYFVVDGITVRLSSLYNGSPSVGNFTLLGQNTPLYASAENLSIVMNDISISASVTVTPSGYFQYNGVWDPTTGAQLLDPLTLT